MSRTPPQRRPRLPSPDGGSPPVRAPAVGIHASKVRARYRRGIGTSAMTQPCTDAHMWCSATVAAQRRDSCAAASRPSGLQRVAVRRACSARVSRDCRECRRIRGSRSTTRSFPPCSASTSRPASKCPRSGSTGRKTSHSPPPSSAASHTPTTCASSCRRHRPLPARAVSPAGRRLRAQVLRPTPRSGARSDIGLSSQSIAHRPDSRTLR
jgi:hypothetical protein